MFSFNPLKLPSVKVVKDDVIEKKQIIDDGVPVVITTKKKKIKPGERLVKQYKKSQRTTFRRNVDDYDEIIEKIGKVLLE